MGIDSRTQSEVDASRARSWLFVPGDRDDRFANAAGSGADIVVYDLEDGVATNAKSSARAKVVGALGEDSLSCVRVNSANSSFYDADIAALAGAPGLHAVMVPKAEDPEGLARLNDTLGPRTMIVALIETALGLHRAYELSSVRGVARLAFGSIDFALDIGAEEAELALLLARSSLVVASRAARIAAPVDGITARLDDPRTVIADSAAAASLGFGGKLCIHPSQVEVVNAAFSPSAEEILRARRIMNNFAHDGAQRLDGRMVDRPVVERAEQVLRWADLERLAGDTRRS